MGLFAPLAPRLLRTFGSQRAVSLSLALVVAMGVVRALVPGAALVLAFTIPLGVGIAVAGTLLPVVVKEELSDRPTLGTGMYTAGINLGATLAAVAAVPLATLVGWRGALLVFSGAIVLVLAVWLQHRPAAVRERAVAVRLPFDRPVVWLLAAAFALQSSLFYGFNAWLADAYVERGWSGTSAGGLVGAVNAVALVVGLATALAADRAGSRRLYLMAASAAATVAAALIAAGVPGTWVWSVLLGAALGVLFTIVMTLPLDVSHGPADVVATTSVMLGIGYVFSAIAPASLGAVRDATGSFELPLALLAVDAAVLLALVPLLSFGRLRPPPRIGVFTDVAHTPPA
jgi:MFS transporter, CP family, cyanate transporter